MNRRTIGIALVTLTLGGVLVTPAAARGQATAVAPFNDSIHKQDLRADLFFIASDGMKGRLATSPENRLAAEYIKSRFERLGLKPAGPEGSYFQRFNLTYATLGEDNLLELTRGPRAALRLRAPQDFYPQRFSASGRVKGPVVYVGFGIDAPRLGYSDYRGVELEGKIVLVLDNEPGAKDPDSPFDGVVRSRYSSPLVKALTAQEKGAVGILFVQDVHNQTGPGNFEARAKRYWPEGTPRRQRYRLETWVDKVRIPAAQISPALAETMLQGTRKTLRPLAEAAETDHGMKPIPLPGVELELTTSVNRHAVSDRNVVALLEGADEALKNEWVILCAHYDHVGVDAEGRAFNGADDDGSGTVALLEIAEAYALAAAEGKRPRRSLLFAAWNSEEAGLLGSWAYAEQPLKPLAKTVAILNMDMIGRNQQVPEGGGRRFRGLEVQSAESNRNSLLIVGHTYSDELLSEIRRANEHFGLDLKTGYDNNVNNILRRSDQWPFLQHDVPAVLFTTGFHPEYHTINDDPQKVNYDKLEKIVRLVHHLSWSLAQGEGRPKMNPDKLRPTTP